MSHSNDLRELDQAWRAVLEGVKAGRLNPQALTQHLNDIADGELDRIGTSIQQLIGRVELLRDELNLSLRDLGFVNAAGLNMPIAVLNLSSRARKACMRLGLSTVGDLTVKTPKEVLEVRHSGDGTLQEIRKKLARHGLKLSGDQ